MPACECGCGGEANVNKRFISGHNRSRPIIPPHERIVALSVTNTETNCWEFQGASIRGYGCISLPGGKKVLAHRVMWEYWNDEKIPDGEHIDHLCRNPPCVNPDHLEPVTPGVNAWRGRSPSILLHRANRCAKGHSLDPEILYVDPGSGVRRCKICRREHARSYYLRNRHKWNPQRKRRCE